ncbi:HIT family protein [Nitrosopumilus sp. K4]|uniref:HIT family protein n=1 Tax=Nitrosopumilus sp. K4 TaxID=2795383 RepID=UPI001BA60361|nr:HIT family protein [Nitrosopumilus sp. K4]QUC65641.1 HIT family protein [Nitrosopumilus sp. K4]
MTDCVFCKIISGNIPVKKISESEKSIAFLDAFPLAKGHVLVIPKNHHAKIQDLSKEENSDLFSLMHDVVSKVDALTGATLIAVHNGKDAGQEIPHVHVHLVPRDSSDSAGAIHSMFHGTVSLSDSEIDEIRKKLV